MLGAKPVVIVVSITVQGGGQNTQLQCMVHLPFISAQDKGNCRLAMASGNQTRLCVCFQGIAKSCAVADGSVVFNDICGTHVTGRMVV